MSLKEKQEQLAEVQSKMNKLYNQLIPLQNKAKNLREEIRQLEFDTLLPLTPEKVMTANYQVFENKSTYKALQEFLKPFKFIMCEGYNPTTEKKALKIKLSQKETAEKQLAELNQFLPFVSRFDRGQMDISKRIQVPSELTGQIRVVSIFEHTCSEYGSYSLLVGDNDMCAILLIRYSSPRIEKILPLAEMVKYIKENHPYELEEYDPEF